MYTNNLLLVDRLTERLVATLEAYYRGDGRTAYIFTSDHGMSARGSYVFSTSRHNTCFSHTKRIYTQCTFTETVAQRHIHTHIRRL